VFRGADGKTLTLDDLQPVSASFQYENIGRKDLPAEAEALHRQASQACETGDYDKAIALLERSIEMAPDWPYPTYDLACTYFLKGDFIAATKFYKKTVEMVPRGYFTAITALDTLQREQKGELPFGTYRTFVGLDEFEEPEERAAEVRKLVKGVPGFAPGWKELADVMTNDGERLSAIEKGLAAEPDPETKGQLLVGKAMILERQGNRQAAVRLLGELILDPYSTFATEQLARSNLAIVARN
jgi:tetratricopeptide (TPR) repeat protein